MFRQIPTDMNGNGVYRNAFASLLARPIILAFLTHTTLEWLDDKYQRRRLTLPVCQRLFNDLRTLTSDLCFMLDVMMPEMDGCAGCATERLRERPVGL